MSYENFMNFINHGEIGGVVKRDSVLLEAGCLLDVESYRTNPIPYLTPEDLDQLEQLYRSVFFRDWGETLPFDAFQTHLEKVADNAVLTLIRDNEQLKGAALISFLPRYQVINSISEMVKLTTGENISLDALSVSLPAKVAYWDELFIDPEYRVGIEPYRTLASSTIEGITSKFGVGNELVFFTKGHKRVPDKIVTELQDILGQEADELIVCLNKNDAKGAKELLMNPSNRVLQIIDKYGRKKRMSVMDAAKKMRMEDLTPVELKSYDRYIFKAKIDDLEFFSSQRNRLRLAIAAAVINLKNLL